MSECVRVVVRCRPFSQRELNQKETKIVKVKKESNQIEIAKPESDRNIPKPFTFDNVWDDDSTQREVYDETASELVESVMQGYNATIFAYGQTGCGKTYTMQGVLEYPEKRGVIPNSFVHIFDTIALDTSKQWLVRGGFIEIYQEEIRDLLGNDPHKKLDLRENVDRGVYIQDLTYTTVTDSDETLSLMEKGDLSRHTAATAMNATSSRSHSIFICYVESSEPDEATGEPKIKGGKLNLVDLAGSERQSKTHAEGQRLKEATKINLSLSALGNVISALVEGKGKHIPYRDSKLTRLLQDSLGGNTKTCMIAAISPACFNYDETLSTLRYANRAKNIKNKPVINEDPKDALLRQYKDEISRLKYMLAAVARGEALESLDFMDDEPAPSTKQPKAIKGTTDNSESIVDYSPSKPGLDRRKTMLRVSLVGGKVQMQEKDVQNIEMSSYSDTAPIFKKNDPNMVFSNLKAQAEAKTLALQAKADAQSAGLKVQEQARLEADAQSAKARALAEQLQREAEAEAQQLRSALLEAQVRAQAAEEQAEKAKQDMKDRYKKLKLQKAELENMKDIVAEEKNERKAAEEQLQKEIEEAEHLFHQLKAKEKRENVLLAAQARALQAAETQAKKRAKVEAKASKLLAEHQAAADEAARAAEDAELLAREMTLQAAEEAKLRHEEIQRKEEEQKELEQRMTATVGGLAAQKDMIMREVKRMAKEKAHTKKKHEARLAKEHEKREALQRKIDEKQALALHKKKKADKLAIELVSERRNADDEKQKASHLLRLIEEKEYEHQQEREMIENQAEMQIKNSEGEKQVLQQQLQKLEEQLLRGGTHNDASKKQMEAKIRRQNRELARKAAIERQMKQEQEHFVEEKETLVQNYNSLTEELDGNRKLLVKLKKQLKRSDAELRDVQEEFERQRELYIEDIREVVKEASLMKSIAEKVIGEIALNRIVNTSVWTEENEWELPMMMIPVKLPEMSVMKHEKAGSRGATPRSHERGSTPTRNREDSSSPRIGPTDTLDIKQERKRRASFSYSPALDNLQDAPTINLLLDDDSPTCASPRPRILSSPNTNREREKERHMKMTNDSPRTDLSIETTPTKPHKKHNNKLQPTGYEGKPPRTPNRRPPSTSSDSGNDLLQPAFPKNAFDESSSSKTSSRSLAPAPALTRELPSKPAFSLVNNTKPSNVNSLQFDTSPISPNSNDTFTLINTVPKRANFIVSPTYYNSSSDISMLDSVPKKSKFSLNQSPLDFPSRKGNFTSSHSPIGSDSSNIISFLDNIPKKTEFNALPQNRSNFNVVSSVPKKFDHKFADENNSLLFQPLHKTDFASSHSPFPKPKVLF